MTFLHTFFLVKVRKNLPAHDSFISDLLKAAEQSFSNEVCGSSAVPIITTAPPGNMLCTVRCVMEPQLDPISIST
jgi:hypothetical protein